MPARRCAFVWCRPTTTSSSCFDRRPRNAAECSGHLVRLVSGGPDAAGAAQAVISAEHTGDAVIRAILERLASAFVTPFDREDIHALAEEIDDVVDELRAVVALLELPPLDGMLPEVVEQAQLVALAFDYTNGFHDAANSIATVVSTRVLSPRWAVMWPPSSPASWAPSAGTCSPSTRACRRVRPTPGRGIAGGAVARFGPDVLISSGLRKIGVFIVLSPAHRVGPGDGVHDCGVVDI